MMGTAGVVHVAEGLAVSVMLTALYQLYLWRRYPPIPTSYTMTPTSAVFDSFGVLEHILSFVSVPDLVTASYVSKRWKEAARSDFLWKPLCQALWKGKWSMPHVNDEEGNEVRRFDQGSVFE